MRLLRRDPSPEMRAFSHSLTPFFEGEMLWLHSQRLSWRESSDWLIGFPVWGESYLDRFRECFCASALSGRNLEVLRRRTALLVYCGRRDVSWVTDWGRTLRSLGIELLVREIPEDLLRVASSAQRFRYPLLGTVQNLLVQAAGRWGMRLHPGLPDHVYQDGYFANLDGVAESGKFDAVVQNTLSVSERAASPEIDSMRGIGGSLALSEVEVGDLALAHTHPQMATGLMNGASDYPGHHFMHWRGEDHCHIAYINGQPTYMSPGLCLGSKVKLWGTLDGQLPQFLSGARTFVPGPGDGLAYLEVSAVDEKEAIPRRRSLLEYVAMTWDVVGFDESYLPWLGVPHRFAASETTACLGSDAIAAAHSHLMASMTLLREEAMALVMRETLSAEQVRWAAEEDHIDLPFPRDSFGNYILEGALR